MIKKIFFFTLFFFLIKSESNVILISVPKSGTWFLAKYIQRLTGRKNAIHTLLKLKVLKSYKEIDESIDFENPFKVPSDAIHFFSPNINLLPIYISLMNYHQFFVSHLIYFKKYEDFFLKNDFKAIFLIRDPRDLLISRANYILKNKKLFPALQNLSFDELLLKLIGSENFECSKFNDLYSSHICYHNEPKNEDISNIGYFYSNYLGWLNSPLCLTIKFEDLVGSKGGGCDKKQCDTLVKISRYLDGNSYLEKIKDVMPKLFGGTSTFHKGQIGSWKKHFKQHHKDAFKKVGNRLLITLGYENSIDW